jgi:hypothetical protein
VPEQALTGVDLIAPSLAGFEAAKSSAATTLPAYRDPNRRFAGVAV